MKADSILIFQNQHAIKSTVKWWPFLGALARDSKINFLVWFPCHYISVIKINNSYHKQMFEKCLYPTVKHDWSFEVRSIKWWPVSNVVFLTHQFLLLWVWLESEKKWWPKLIEFLPMCSLSTWSLDLNINQIC